MEFVSMMPLMKPRVFTISSSSTMFPNTVHLTISILKEKLPNGSSRTGINSQYIVDCQKRLEKGEQVFLDCFVDESGFSNKPVEENQDIVMIATGCGLAPFRAFL